jgi:hypothetical protein
MPTGTNPRTLVGTVFGANPFQDPASRDFTLAPNSTAIGAASNSVNGLPDKEYFQNETVTRMYRVRTAARDIGAFESTTTGNGIGPYDAPSAQNGAHGCTSSGALSNGPISLLPLALLALRARGRPGRCHHLAGSCSRMRRLARSRRSRCSSDRRPRTFHCRW